MNDGTRYDVAEAPAVTCPECGGRQWRRQIGVMACGCIVRDVRALASRLAAVEAELAALRETHDVG